MGIVGCTVGPNYRRPDVQVPPAWSEGSDIDVTTQPCDIARWWKTFNDPELDGLSERAVQSNLDLRLAVAHVREALALRGIAASDQWPTINVSGAYTGNRQSENVSPAQGGSLNGSSPTGAALSGTLEQDLFQAGFDVSWEIDLFGEVRRSIEAADADLAPPWKTSATCW